MNRTLILLDKRKVNVIDLPHSDPDVGIAWDYRSFDAGTEFDEDEENVTWLIDNRWEEGIDFKWLNK